MEQPIKMNKKTILFLCTHNAARSQMAEGLMNSFLGTHFEAFSAGVESTQVHPYAIQVMKELDIDISDHQSKHINVFKDRSFDIVVTVCDHAQETCPFFPGKQVLHQSFYDPSQVEGSEEEQLAVFRRVRDDIKTWILTTFEEGVNG
jgi:arsenate reductase